MISLEELRVHTAGRLVMLGKSAQGSAYLNIDRQEVLKDVTGDYYSLERLDQEVVALQKVIDIPGV